MSHIDMLTNEQKLLVRLSRLSFSDNDKAEIGLLIDQSIDWYEWMNLGLKNKVFALTYLNLCDMGYKGKISSKIDQLAMYYVECNCTRNKTFFDELHVVSKAFNIAGIKYAALKGAYLLPYIYIEYGSRLMNDIDIFVNKKDIVKIDTVMKDLGYKQNDYDRSECQLTKPSREKLMLWKSSMNNLYPYRKIIEEKKNEVMTFDFSFKIDLTNNTNDIVGIMNERSFLDENNQIRYLRPSDFFIHLCSHLYKEATNVEWIALGGDINLIKFCDIREFYLKNMNEEELLLAINEAKRLKLQDSIYYTMHYLRAIYNDGYEEDIINMLEVSDKSILDSFGKREYGENVKWNKTFWERVFSYNNRDSLKTRAKFINFYS